MLVLKMSGKHLQISDEKELVQMPNVDIRTQAVCIQALEDAIRYYDLLSQSETTDSDDYEESKYRYEVELSRLCEIYATEEEKGLAPVPLKKLLKNAG